MVDTRHETSLACGSEGEGSKRANDDHVLHFDTRPSTAHAASGAHGLEVIVRANRQQEAGDDQIIVVENCVQDHTANRQELARAMIEAREALAASKQVVAAEVNMAEAKEDKQMFTSGESGKGRFATELRVEREKKGNRTAPDATRTL